MHATKEALKTYLETAYPRYESQILERVSELPPIVKNPRRFIEDFISTLPESQVSQKNYAARKYNST